eukprot:6205821-Pleurochrysis_carterae.AAC.2
MLETWPPCAFGPSFLRAHRSAVLMCVCGEVRAQVMEAIEAAGYAGKCTVGLDVAASEFKVKSTPSGKDAVYDLGM